ncbi:thiol-disulfide isomerase/thioredoxin [Lacinutrix venerupis]|uniref:Thiol:disulfide interchange protein n=1 Tax=Lacinutrix venerupis TaxID=1486034 RepID=A0AAC9PXQ4_9FLAO|nr:TlpA disulfide reductase family protein [Lacinutrix venerupis]APY01180.1 thiol:disulfide interchange protein [Lacinutrix venerupis]RLJ67345.1 thiol-disulfide isomerase/thioredoxin [Lacinutrix venerupis]
MKKFFHIFLLTLSFNLYAQENLPSAEIKSLNGDTTTLQEISKKNDLIVVSLWATWCVPCKNELDAINDVYVDWQDETNVKLYAISVDDSRTVSRVKPLVNGKAWDFDILLDTNNDLKRELGASTVPLTLIIKNGKIVYRHSGYTPGAEDVLFDEIKKHS